MSATRFSLSQAAAFVIVAATGAVGLVPLAQAQEEAGKAAAATSQAAESGVPSGITARGTGQAKAQPERAVLTFAVAVGGRDADGTGAGQVQAMARKVVDALRQSGIPEADIVIASPSGPRSGLGGFGGGGFGGGGNGTTATLVSEGDAPERLTRFIAVTVRQLANAQSIAEKAVEAGAFPNFTVRLEGADAAAVRSEALKKAVEDATEKAKAMASAAGIRDIRLAGIKEESVGFFYLPQIDVDARREKIIDLLRAVPPVQATVTVRYALPNR